MAAALRYGEILGKGDLRWRELLADLAGATGGVPAINPPRHPHVPVQREPDPGPVYPPPDEVDALWGCAWGILDDEISPAGQLHGLLRSRALDPAMMAHRDVARVVRPGYAPEWLPPCANDTHRLIVPLHDAGGRRRSVRFRATAPGQRIKARSPTDYNITGLVMADSVARSLLRSNPAGWDRRVVIAEGEPDFWTWTTNEARWLAEVDTGHTYAVFGIVPGSWTPAIAARIPDGATVIIRTDHDEPGERYARIIFDSLSNRCRCLRPPPPQDSVNAD